MQQVTFSLNILLVIDVLSIATAFMLGLLFLTSKSSNKKANIFLGIFLWSLAVEVLESFLELVIINSSVVNLIQTSFATIVLLYLYVVSTFRFKLKTSYLSLFIPFLIVNILNLEEGLTKFFEYFFNVWLLVMILKEVKNHQNKITNFYSDIENKTLIWIKTIVYIYLFFHALWVIEDLIGINNEETVESFAFTSSILTFFMIYWIGYNGFSQSEIFTSKLFLKADKIEEEKKQITISYSKSDFYALVKIIEEQKLYSNTNLNLKTLALKLNVKEKILSQMINSYTENNFYHFINNFRVKEFKRLLMSPEAEKLSLLGLAEEAGFSSKSTFYSVFKKSEGITPKQYQNQLKKSN